MRTPRQNMPRASLPPTVSASNDADIIDLAMMAELLGDNHAKMRELALKFMASARSNMIEIEAALLNNDLAALGALGHHNIGSAGLIGASSFAKLCQLLEKQAKNGGDTEQLADTVKQMHSVLNLINAQIAKDLA